MDIIEKLANYRQQRVTDLSDSHVKRLQDSLRELENQVISEASKIDPTRGTLKLRTTAAIAIRPKLKNIIENTYLTAVQSNINEYDKAASWLVATFKEYPIPDEFKQITELDLTTIQQLKRAAYLPFEDLGNEFSNELAQEVYNSTITGKPTDQMISDLRGKINGVYQSTDNEEAQELVDFINNNPDKTEAIQTAATRLQTIYGRDRLGNNLRRYATQMVQDSLMGFDGQFAKYRADELGLTHYVYSGTTVRDSRDFCRTHVGKIYNEEEIRQIWSSQTWQGKAQGDPFIKRGGYNCRHHWQPTDPEWGKEDDDFPTTDDIKEQQAQNIFGEVSDDEAPLLPIAFGTVATSFTKAISKLPKTATINSRSKGAWYQKSTDTVALKGVDMNDYKLRYTFAHEYGHRIDHKISDFLYYNEDIRDRIFAKELKKTPLLVDYIAGFRGARQISNFAAPSMIDDRKRIKKYIAAAKIQYINDLERLAKTKLNKSAKVMSEEVEKIINSKDFPLTVDEVKALLKEKGIDYDPTTVKTIDFVLQTKNKILSAENPKSILRDVADVSFGKFADYLGAITNNEMGWGHRMGYYKAFPATLVKGIRTGHSAEAFANYTALLNGQNKVAYRKLMEYYAKDTTKAFDELMERINQI